MFHVKHLRFITSMFDYIYEKVPFVSGEKKIKNI